MDSYKKLKIEFPGINDVIMKYTGTGNIANFLNNLELGIINGDGDTIMYSLNEIYLWYQKHIDEIHSNQYVYNQTDHDRNKNLVEEILNELKNYDFSRISCEKETCSAEMLPKIFLSHCSPDKKYGDALEKIIVGLGVRNDQLIYTSHPLHKIPIGKNIYEYLRENINRNVFVIILWSNEYLESPACLNEMGAAWVTQADYVNMYTPDFAFGNPKYHQCAVDTRKMGAVLNADSNCKASMIEFKDKMLKLFELEASDKTWTYLLDQFIKEIQ